MTIRWNYTFTKIAQKNFISKSKVLINLEQATHYFLGVDSELFRKWEAVDKGGDYKPSVIDWNCRFCVSFLDDTRRIKIISPLIGPKDKGPMRFLR